MFVVVVVVVAAHKVGRSILNISAKIELLLPPWKVEHASDNVLARG